MASICSGTFILAKAGLLEGKQATTQWSVCQRLAREHPEIKVVPDKIFIRDGNIYSSAGVKPVLIWPCAWWKKILAGILHGSLSRKSA